LQLSPIFNNKAAEVQKPVKYRVFITSTPYTGNLGGLTGADSKCQEKADVANLGGQWKAWLSDSQTSAASRLIHSDYQYIRIDGIVVANNWADLTDGSLQNTITIDETGNLKTTYTAAWTNTQTDGSSYYSDYGKSCNNWTAGYWGPSAILGFASHIDGLWTIGFGPSTTTCQNMGSLYCFEQTPYVPTPTITPTPTPTNTPTPTPTRPPKIFPTDIPTDISPSVKPRPTIIIKCPAGKTSPYYLKLPLNVCAKINGCGVSNCNIK